LPRKQAAGQLRETHKQSINHANQQEIEHIGMIGLCLYEPQPRG
jgi:hypothetical protein